MKYFEFGRENPELMVMLPGGGVCYRGAIPTAEEMAKVYHVVLVAYDGFNPDEPETEFSTTRHEARSLGDFVAENFGGKIDVLYGVSYGCFILMDVLSDERLTITTTIADGMPTMDYPDIKNPVLQNLYLLGLTGFAYTLIGRAGPIRRKIVCKMMDRTPESFDRIVYRDATWRSWANQDRCMIGRHKDLSLFARTDMHIWHGIRSSTEKKLAKHIAAWQEDGYAFTYKVFPDLGHGSLAGEHVERFSQEVQTAHQSSLKKCAN
jgi:pimeloyl-ACP methyl ester carboxylesterase